MSAASDEAEPATPPRDALALPAATAVRRRVFLVSRPARNLGRRRRRHPWSSPSPPRAVRWR
eukprot:CAMPEP_0179697124 /NCGR_PEP_ID=MMETSP0936-20121108/7228_1 /TAXON_ID=548131 ORGANISM="Ostreococcus mediterraneus, Strain clade-D-RCC2573" /NCGR_SAMPLE_ID=MMETSP0936 /ASSEMBLY_ACC=CAM_ASM_000574 /LENGTH=61 /DNA_ID=CAMNT_0021570109 /DNA_START=313 /DNA_END=494 /DNA_ORIENTATION=-